MSCTFQINYDDTATVTVAGDGSVGSPFSFTAVGGGATVINDSPTVTVAGTGTVGDPFVLTAVGGGAATVINDTPTVTVAGAGTVGDPFLLTAAPAPAITAAPTPAEKLAVNYPLNVVAPGPVANYTFLHIDDGVDGGSEVWQRHTTPSGNGDWRRVS